MQYQPGDIIKGYITFFHYIGKDIKSYDELPFVIAKVNKFYKGYEYLQTLFSDNDLETQIKKHKITKEQIDNFKGFFLEILERHNFKSARKQIKLQCAYSLMPPKEFFREDLYNNFYKMYSPHVTKKKPLNCFWRVDSLPGITNISVIEGNR